MPVELKPFARITAIVLLGASLGLGGCQCFECETEEEGATKVSAEKAAAPMGDDPVVTPEPEVVWYDPTTWFVWLDGEKKPVRKGEPIPFEAYSAMGYQLQWSSFAAIQPEGQIEAVDFLDGVIVARDNRAAFTAISPRSGDIRWAKLQGYGLANFIGVVKSGENLLLVEEGQILPVSADQGVPVLNSFGTPVAQKLGRVVQTAPLEASGMLLFGSESGHAIAHVTRAGVTSWQYLIGGRILARPTLLGSGGAAFVSTGGDVVVLSPEVGSAMGRAKVFGAIEASAAAGVDRFFVVSRDQSVYAFDDSNAAPLWRVRTEAQLTIAPAYFDGKVYVQVPGTGLMALEAGTGKQAWVNKSVGGTVVGTRKGRLVVWDGTRATVVETVRGDVISTADLPGLKDFRVQPFIDGDLYATWASGQIARFVGK